jgi:hypothetical protein
MNRSRKNSKIVINRAVYDVKLDVNQTSETSTKNLIIWLETRFLRAPGFNVKTSTEERIRRVNGGQIERAGS